MYSGKQVFQTVVRYGSVVAISLGLAYIAWIYNTGSLELDRWNYFIMSNKDVYFFAMLMTLSVLTAIVARTAKDKKRKAIIYILGFSIVYLSGYAMTLSV